MGVKVAAPPRRRLVAYIRVSTDKQADEGLGLEIQEHAIREWARAQKARVVHVARDEGRSGNAEVIDRPGLAEALGYLRDGRADALVVYRLDRLARDLIPQEVLRSEILRMGGELRSTSSVEDLHLREDPTDPTGQLVRRILGAIAEYERAMIRLRMDAGKARKRDAGGYVGGQPPYGWSGHAGELVAVPREQETLARMKRWRRAGWSYQRIADTLNSEGIPSRRGTWHRAAIARILARRGPRGTG